MYKRGTILRIDPPYSDYDYLYTLVISDDLFQHYFIPEGNFTFNPNDFRKETYKVYSAAMVSK